MMGYNRIFLHTLIHMELLKIHVAKILEDTETRNLKKNVEKMIKNDENVQK